MVCRHTPNSEWDQKLKTVFFLKVVLLHIKLKGMEQAHILALYTASVPGIGSKGQLFSECVHVAYQIKGKEV